MPAPNAPQEFQVDDLTDVIDELATGIYTVTRPSATVYVAGVRQAPTTTSFVTKAVVWPTSGEELDRLPEGLRTHDAINIVTKDQLNLASNAQEPDVVTINGDTYQCQTSQRWKPSGNFFMVIATRVEKL